MKIVQIFNPPLRICSNNCDNMQIVEAKEWHKGENDESSTLEYIGMRQIEEVWKHYWKEYFISNYGYIVKISKEELYRLREDFPEEFSNLVNADEKSSGVKWGDFSNEIKDVFRKNAFVPLNRKGSGCQICLSLTGKTDKYDIHRLVARFFLQKPEDYADERYIVHHIDNNSYNNCVTNLIYLKRETHLGVEHHIYHPMSHKR